MSFGLWRVYKTHDVEDVTIRMKSFSPLLSHEAIYTEMVMSYLSEAQQYLKKAEN